MPRKFSYWHSFMFNPFYQSAVSRRLGGWIGYTVGRLSNTTQKMLWKIPRVLFFSVRRHATIMNWYLFLLLDHLSLCVTYTKFKLYFVIQCCQYVLHDIRFNFIFLKLRYFKKASPEEISSVNIYSDEIYCVRPLLMNVRHTAIHLKYTILEYSESAIL